MNEAEPLCDLRFVKAEYHLAKSTGQPVENSFLVTSRPLVSNGFSAAEKEESNLPRSWMSWQRLFGPG